MTAFVDLPTRVVDCGDARIFVRHGGSGPPLLLLHGYPQTHMMWRRVADELTDRFHVIAPDIRGYGRSTLRDPTAGHEAYAKRAMALDMVAVMAAFGYDRFDVAGHDRGGRIAYRLALDHPALVRRVSVLDIIPTGEVWDRADARFALGYWHWPFLAQPAPHPERLIGADPEAFFFGAQFPGAKDYLDPVGYEDYLACAARPGVIHAMCQDYRAGASIDRTIDAEDAGKRQIEAPLQILWGARGALERWYDVPSVWRTWARHCTGITIDAGHFIPEERPAEVAQVLAAFHQPAVP